MGRLEIGKLPSDKDKNSGWQKALRDDQLTAAENVPSWISHRLNKTVTGSFARELQPEGRQRPADDSSAFENIMFRPNGGEMSGSLRQPMNPYRQIFMLAYPLVATENHRPNPFSQRPVVSGSGHGRCKTV